MTQGLMDLNLEPCIFLGSLALNTRYRINTSNLSGFRVGAFTGLRVFADFLGWDFLHPGAPCHPKLLAQVGLWVFQKI